MTYKSPRLVSQPSYLTTRTEAFRYKLAPPNPVTLPLTMQIQQPAKMHVSKTHIQGGCAARFRSNKHVRHETYTKCGRQNIPIDLWTYPLIFRYRRLRNCSYDMQIKYLRMNQKKQDVMPLCVACSYPNQELQPSVRRCSF